MVQKWSRNVRKIFFSDFDEIWRGNSQKYGDSKYQKKFSKFSFFGPFFNSVRERTVQRQKFLLQNFLFTKKSTGANSKHIPVGVKKVVFSSNIENWGVADLPPGGHELQN